MTAVLASQDVSLAGSFPFPIKLAVADMIKVTSSQKCHMRSKIWLSLINAWLFIPLNLRFFAPNFPEIFFVVPAISTAIKQHGSYFSARNIFLYNSDCLCTLAYRILAVSICIIRGGKYNTNKHLRDVVHVPKKMSKAPSPSVVKRGCGPKSNRVCSSLLRVVVAPKNLEMISELQQWSGQLGNLQSQDTSIILFSL